VGHGAASGRPRKESLGPCKARVRELVGIEREKTDWKMLAEPPAVSRPDLTLSATVEEDMSKLKRERGRQG
jgi:hypothetical protein